jgi:hypothetical protein
MGRPFQARGAGTDQQQGGDQHQQALGEGELDEAGQHGSAGTLFRCRLQRAVGLSAAQPTGLQRGHDAGDWPAGRPVTRAASPTRPATADRRGPVAGGLAGFG